MINNTTKPNQLNGPRNFATKKGTTLPLLDYKGKDYLEVANRLIWFREEFPQHAIETEVVHFDNQVAVVRATIKTPEGKVWASGTGIKARDPMGKYVSTAETSAVGRALNFCGFGTQFATQEMEEGDDLADSPREREVLASPHNRAHRNTSSGYVTQNRAKRLWAIAKSNGWTQEDLDMFKGNLSIESFYDLNQLQYNELCDKILPNGPQGKYPEFDASTQSSQIRGPEANGSAPAPDMARRAGNAGSYNPSTATAKRVPTSYTIKEQEEALARLAANPLTAPFDESDVTL